MSDLAREQIAALLKCSEHGVDCAHPRCAVLDSDFECFHAEGEAQRVTAQLLATMDALEAEQRVSALLAETGWRNELDPEARLQAAREAVAS